jgi:hypothetical protein
MLVPPRWKPITKIGAGFSIKLLEALRKACQAVPAESSQQPIPVLREQPPGPLLSAAAPG